MNELKQWLRCFSFFPTRYISQWTLDGLRLSPSLWPPQEVYWQYSDIDTLILNVYGNALTNWDKIAYDSLVRNFYGQIQFGYYGSVGLRNILHEEIKSYLTKLILVEKQVFGKFLCFIDFTSCFSTFSKGNIDVSSLYTNLLELMEKLLWNHYCYVKS